MTGTFRKEHTMKEYKKLQLNFNLLNETSN